MSLHAREDEEEEDLDDLDDLLEEFDEETVPKDSAAVNQTTLPELTKNGMPALGSDDFAKQLQSGMEDLMRELESSPEARKDFEQLMSQMGTATLDSSTKTTEANTTSYPNNSSKSNKIQPETVGAKTPKNFQDTLSANLARMKETDASSSEATAALSGSEENDAFMEEMMRQFEQAAGHGEGEGDFSKILEGMMAQLMSKEILYEPLLELHQKYPDWIKLHPEDKNIDTYKAQSKLVEEIVAKFEDRNYRDEDETKKAEVMALMGRMQELGSPPTAIMSDDLGVLDPTKMPGGGEDCSIM